MLGNSLLRLVLVPAMDWSILKQIIDQNQSFLITSHVRPDADALGSELGMRAILQAMGKTVTIVNASAPPANLDYEMWTGPAPMRPFNALTHPRRWRAFMEYGNGIVGDMCIHMLDMVRWMMDLGWPNSVSSNGGILVDKASRANITDTQTATFDYGNVQVRWTHRTWGEGGDPKYPWSATFYGDKGTLKASVFGYDYTPQGGGNPVHKEVGMELDQYPEDQTEKDLEKHCAPAIRGHMRNLLECRRSGSKPVADIEQGHMSTTSCVLANLSQQLGGRTLRWDPKTHTIVGDPEATRLLARPYRSPWTHPTAASV